MAAKRKAEQEVESEAVLTKSPCPVCPSSDAFAVYTDGHGFCFSCGKRLTPAKMRGTNYASYVPDAGMASSPSGDLPVRTNLKAAEGEVADFLRTAKTSPIKSRGLTHETTKRWGYLVRKHPTNHSWQQIAVSADKHGQPVALHVRDTGHDGSKKDFFWIGEKRKIKGLWGQNLWGHSGKMLVITEGEIDAMSVSQVFDLKWPVWSITQGVDSAAKEVTQELQALDRFEKVVFLFDQDQPGRDAAVECAKLLPPGKAYIATLSMKDANQVLVEGDPAEIMRACWNAKPYRPDGIVDARTLTKECLRPVQLGKPWPWRPMTNMTFGRRRGEVYTFGAGPGVGKTDLMAEIKACLLLGTTKYGEKFEPTPLAYFGFESTAAQTKNAIAGKIFSQRFHIPNLPGEEPLWADADRIAAHEAMDGDIWDAGGKLFLNDSHGKAEWAECVSRMRYLNKAEAIHDFFIDPISALTAGSEDERKEIDAMILEASSLSVELDASIYLVSHLTDPSTGPMHEEGGEVRLKQFRGSRAIGMFTTYAFGLERNLFAETEAEQVKATLRCVKDRYTGNSTNKTFNLYYDRFSGTLDVENTGKAV